jgi:hypothetical protein
LSIGNISLSGQACYFGPIDEVKKTFDIVVEKNDRDVFGQIREHDYIDLLHKYAITGT